MFFEVFCGRTNQIGRFILHLRKISINYSQPLILDWTVLNKNNVKPHENFTAWNYFPKIWIQIRLITISTISYTHASIKPVNNIKVFMGTSKTQNSRIQECMHFFDILKKIMQVSSLLFLFHLLCVSPPFDSEFSVSPFGWYCSIVLHFFQSNSRTYYFLRF
jgi:hypothetical protein